MFASKKGFSAVHLSRFCDNNGNGNGNGNDNGKGNDNSNSSTSGDCNSSRRVEQNEKEKLIRFIDTVGREREREM